MAGISSIGTMSQSDYTNRAPRFSQTRPITRLSTGADGQEAKGASVDPVLSADGNTLAFASDASNLVDSDTNGVRDIFVKNLQTNAVTRISVAADGTDADDASDGLYKSVSLSADGTKVAFASKANNLVPGDTNGASDIFVRNLANNTTTRVSIAADGAQTPNGSSSTNPVISPDGTKVAFVSSAANLVSGDTNGARDIFVKDLATGTVTRVDTTADGTQAETGSDSFSPVFSPDGTKIAFVSTAGNLVSGGESGTYTVYVKDLNTQAITRVSAAADGTPANGRNASPVFSPDGTKIAFVSEAGNLVGNGTNGTLAIYVKDLNTQAVTRVSTGPDGTPLNLGGDLVPAFSPDGTKIAFVDSLSKQAYIKDLATDALTAVAPVPNASVTQRVAFSSDGTQLIFVSGDSTLVPGDTNAALDVFSAWTGQTTTGLVYDKADRVSSETSGKLTFTDEDVGDTHTVTVKPGDGAVGTLTARISQDSGTAAGVIDWEYTVDHKAVAGLAKGQTKTETFTLTVDDGHGGTADQVVTITIVGDNDAPHITAFGPFKRLSTRSDGREANGASPHFVLSADGNTLVFASDADNLVDGDTNAKRDIFSKDLRTGVVTRLTAVGSTEANGDSDRFNLSPDGKKLVFVSDASNLVDGDTNDTADVFVKDLDTEAIIRLSAPSDGSTPTGTISFGRSALEYTLGSPKFSSDGKEILFSSEVSNLVSGDNNNAIDGFVWNSNTGKITRITTTSENLESVTGHGNGDPVLSPDGKKVAFISYSDNMVPDDTNDTFDIFVKDLDSGAVTRVSTSSKNEQANGPSQYSIFTPDSKKIIFVSDASNLVADDTNSSPDIFIKDLETGTTTRISVGSNGEQLSLRGDLDPVLSPDGTKLAFVDDATGMAYVKNLVTQELIPVAPVPRTSDPISHPSAAESQRLAFSPDGSELIFASIDDTLVADDKNNAIDIFKVRIEQTTTGLVLDKADQDFASVSGTLPFTDPDIRDTHTVTVKPGEGAVGTLTAKISKEPNSSGPGSIAWTYTVDHKSVPALAEGQSRVEMFTVTLDDGHGGTSDQDVTITTRGVAPLAAASNSEHSVSALASAPAPFSPAERSSAGSDSVVRPTAYTAYVVTMYQDHV
ncbi:VCBS repeat-containing protein [Methylobacterium fujisawaense]|uniref:VCBS repeat-containing protein n=1 Tax=Methylobacterium fujisawaense TaxID=107400 RepID=A0ABR6DEM0_9HYPH|nr:VCBS domain-containing protein [Methylobacterium fujisawaense]MBA9064546.1 VCBS repeat-containing protein [Methylobacterium fujisawaense]